MALIKLAGGPLDGQERDIQNPDMMATEYPGYAAVEQIMDPERGQLLRAEWAGHDADQAYYDRQMVTDQERERYGNETGIRDREAQDRARQPQQEDPNRGEPVDRTQGQTTGAQKREAKNEAADAKRRGDESRSAKK